MNRFLLGAVKKAFAQKNVWGASAQRGSAGLRPSLRWGQNDPLFEPELLVLSTVSSHFGDFWVPPAVGRAGPGRGLRPSLLWLGIHLLRPGKLQTKVEFKSND